MWIFISELGFFLYVIFSWVDLFIFRLFCRLVQQQQQQQKWKILSCMRTQYNRAKKQQTSKKDNYGFYSVLFICSYGVDLSSLDLSVLDFQFEPNRDQSTHKANKYTHWGCQINLNCQQKKGKNFESTYIVANVNR